ncbi:hypothetical protein B4U79_06198, partial [Dinothrombium tinctorium]
FASFKVTRSRRAVSSAKSNRLSALERLKQARSGDSKSRLEIKEEQNVYDIVDEDEYCDIVRKRQEDDWIVDDEGIEAYVEDGREIFDDDYVENRTSNRGTKRKPISRAVNDEEYKPKKSIKSFFVNHQRKEEKKNVNLEEDSFLNTLIQEIETKNKVKNDDYHVQVKPMKLLKRKLPVSNPFEKQNTENVKTPSPVKKLIKQEKLDIDLDKLLDIGPVDEIKNDVKLENEADVSQNDSWLAKNESFVESDKVNYVVPPSNELLTYLDFASEGSEKFLKMYWFDAYDGWAPGVVYLFGKVYVQNIKKYVSCCCVVKNIERRLYVLPRKNFTIGDVLKEFSEIVSQKYKIQNIRSKKSKKLYAFDKCDIPAESDYLEVLIPPSNASIPSNLEGKTFSCVFGTNQSYLERLLLDLKLKGPSWIKIKNPTFESVPMSWCKIEFSVKDFSKSISLCDDQSIPPLTLLSLKLKTYNNPQTNQKEIIAISCLCNNEFNLESGSASKYDDHFCVIGKPSSTSGIIFPLNFTTSQISKMYKKTKLFVMSTERELLNFFMARFYQIDPDIIVGHDVQHFDLDLLLSRLTHFKYGAWSKLGRLKRQVLPHKNKDRIPITGGRLVCDIKSSSKELIRLKDYELTELVAEILRKNRFDIEQRILPSFYSSKEKLLRFVNFLMTDNEYILSILQELNILPLVLQITKIAGNIMSRTLLGGRSERNEFLLLHAFHEKNYIVPDKSFSKNSPDIEETDVIESSIVEGKINENKNSASSRRKPAYTGGLVLEPKVGFYDQFILLMDFNSLYPSIIQEFNICFTTVSRNTTAGTLDEEIIPEVPSSDLEEGILAIEIRKLVQSRREVKKLLLQSDLNSELKLRYDVKQKALKLTANSMYGCLGFKYSRFYAKPLASLITYKGREILMHAKTVVEAMGYDVIYGDTDSLMINTNSEDFDKCQQIGTRIQAEINGLYKLLEIEIDGVFRRMLLLKKKKYAALTVKGNCGKEIKYVKEIKGLDIVRRDWSILAKKAGEQILDNILSLDNNSNEIIEKIHSYLRQLGELIVENKIILEDFIISKQLTKNPEDYADKKGLSHVAVALVCNAAGKMEKKFRAGDTVPYIVCLKEKDEENFNSLPSTQRVFHPEQIREDQNLKVDTKYYLSQQVYPVVCRLCDPFESTDRHLIAEFLGVEDCVENNKRNDHVEIDALVDSGKSRYDTCRSMVFKCPNGNCQQTFEVRNLLEDDLSSGSVSFVLAKCRHCEYDFKTATIAFSNQLCQFLRNFINEYYRGWMTCEDPVCGYKTRNFTGPRTRKGPICPECHDGILLLDMTDLQVYLQIMFFNHIFDYNELINDLKSKKPSGTNCKLIFLCP